MQRGQHLRTRNVSDAEQSASSQPSPSRRKSCPAPAAAEPATTSPQLPRQRTTKPCGPITANRNLDPYWRTSIGFDRLFDLMDESLRFEPEDNYPPYNIVRTGEDSYRISLAVAGFKPEQINVTVHQNALTITGQVSDAVSAPQSNARPS
jgi:HSP20 family molecular chaperone IbpA